MYLKVKNLIKHYSSEFPIIKDLSFSVKKGELISFLGESGSGKTTRSEERRVGKECER